MKISNLNWKFILLNSISAIVLILGFRQLVFLFYSGLLEGLLKYNSEIIQSGEFILKRTTETSSDIVINFLIRLSLAGPLATITAVVISWIIASRESIRRINIFIILGISLIVTLLVNKFSIDFHDLIPSLLKILDTVGVKTVFTINAAALLLLASQLYLNQKIKNHFYQQGS
jgi:hypothetical protein